MANIITLDRGLFNPLRDQLAQTKTRFVISYGSAGSGKSFSQAQHEIIKCIEGKEKVLIVRKYGTTLRDSVVSLVTTVLNQWGLESLYNHNKSDQHITFKTGSEILFKGFDDPEKIKSIAGITRVWIEEATELSREDFNQLNLRVRGRDNLQLTLTFNPVDEEHWIKAHFLDTPEVRENTTIIHTTYKDNRFIDEEYKKQLESYATIDPNYYKIYALGQWGGITEGRIFPAWEEIDQFPEVDGYHYGMDFGFANDPTAVVKVLKANDRLYVQEMLYRTGLTNSDIAGAFRSWGYSGQVVICDSAEPKSIEELRRLGIHAVPADKSPGSIMAGIDNLKRLKVLITKNSHNLKKENLYYQWKQDKEGKFLNIPKDFQNHCFDKDTLIITDSGEKRIKDVLMSDKVLTTWGYDNIVSNGITGYNEIFHCEAKFANLIVEIRCTSNHLFFTSLGWKQLRELEPGMILYLNNTSTALNSPCTPGKDTSAGEHNECTGSYGSTITDRCLPDTTSTTKTGIRTTMLSKILNALRVILILQATGKSVFWRMKSGLSLFSKKELRRPRSGTGAIRGLSGTGNTQLNATLGTSHSEKGFVPSAASHSLQTLNPMMYVQTTASQRKEGCRDLTTLHLNVNNAEETLHAPNTTKSSFVQGHVLQSIDVKSGYFDYTWDLTMQHYPEFFANGILVHNCMDSLRYSQSLNLPAYGSQNKPLFTRT